VRLVVGGIPIRVPGLGRKIIADLLVQQFASLVARDSTQWHDRLD
jgi:hypothetical protein